MASKQIDLLALYERLYNHFGPQDWWPVFGNYHSVISSDRRESRNPTRSVVLNAVKDLSRTRVGSLAVARDGPDARFEICIGAVLTQNTAWTNVEKALHNLMAARLMTPERILSSPPATLRRAIRPAGYFNQKTKKLKALAAFLRFHALEHGSEAGWEAEAFRCLGKLPVLKLREALLRVWGIGPETADSIILYALRKPIFVVDVYTKRLLNVFNIRFRTYDEYREFFESQLPRRVKLWNEYHALIVAWGKLFTKDKAQALTIIR